MTQEQFILAQALVDKRTLLDVAIETIRVAGRNEVDSVFDNNLRKAITALTEAKDSLSEAFENIPCTAG